jgi:hypothetical protein
MMMSLRSQKSFSTFTTVRYFDDSSHPFNPIFRQPVNDEYLSYGARFFNAERVFPYDHMFKWMAYGNDPQGKHAGNVKDFFYRREWSFTLAGPNEIAFFCI